jgi:AMMECR1 domain-containing protein
LIIHGTDTSGLLLPQVATKYNFDPEEFLECLCQKAGLKSEAWKDESNRIFRFEAEIFSDKPSTRNDK